MRYNCAWSVHSCSSSSLLAPSMASRHSPQESLPLVLSLGPSLVFANLESEFSQKFRFLKPWESPLPAADFFGSHAQSVRAVLTSGNYRISADVLRRLPSLRFIATASAGLDHIDLPECHSRGIAVASAGSIFSAEVADFTVGLLIDVLRKVSAADRYVREGLWRTKGEYPLGSRLGGKRVGIVGLGRIGSEVAKRLEPLGCIISYNSKKKKLSVQYPYYSNVRDLASESDILIICCALTNETHHLINKEVLIALGKEGYIINVARGAIIDEKEMVQCLVQGDIAGAGLDVFENEPNVPEELFAFDNVVLSPHQAVLTKEATWEIYELMVGNLEAFFSNKPLLSQVIDE